MHFVFALYRYFPHGGLQRDFFRTLQETLARGHRVTVLLAQADALLPESPLLTVMVLPVSGCSNHRRMASFSSAVQKKLAELKPDRSLMFSRIPGGDFYFAADNCLLAECRKNHHRLVLRLLPRYRTFLQLERAIFSGDSATKILTIVPRQIEEYRSCYGTPEERFTLLPPGIDPECRPPADMQAVRRELRKSLDIPEDAIVLLQVAAQFEVKGVDRSIAALAALPEPVRRNVRLLVAGGGKIGTFRKLAEKSGVGAQTLFVGARSDIPRLIAASDLMLHPARKEAAGAVIAESLAIGIPVLASAACGYACLAQGIIPEPFEQEELNRMLLQMLKNLEAISEKVRQKAGKMDFYRRSAIIADLLEKKHG